MNLALPLAILYILGLVWDDERRENKHQPKTCELSTRAYVLQHKTQRYQRYIFIEY